MKKSQTKFDKANCQNISLSKRWLGPYHETQLQFSNSGVKPNVNGKQEKSKGMEENK